jgi:hypothetical protein
MVCSRFRVALQGNALQPHLDVLYGLADDTDSDVVQRNQLSPLMSCAQSDERKLCHFAETYSAHQATEELQIQASE